MPSTPLYHLKASIALLAAFLALSSATANAGSKRAAEEVEGAITVDTATAKQLFDRGTLFIDVRRRRERMAGAIPGAPYLELRRGFEESTVEAIAGRDRPLVLFSAGEHCLRAGKAAELAVDWGYRKVYYYRDGFPAWEGAGYPVETVADGD